MTFRPTRWLPFVLVLLAASAVEAAERLTLGVFAYRPKPIMQARYQPLADYLSAQLRDTRVELRVLGQAEMEQALAQGRLDLVLTNPSHYLVLRSKNRFTGALATQIALENGMATTHLGGVVIAAASRPELARLGDLEGRLIAIPGTKFLGGYQTQAFELLQAGIRLPEQARLVDVGSHDSVVYAVLEGRADAGFIRTGVIENLAAEGKLDPARLTILNRQQPPRFPYRVSTRLYPEWPFIALPHIDDGKVRRLAAALLSLDAEHPAARAANIAGFAPPADYLPVEQLAQALRLPPYDKAPELTWRELWQQYAPWISAIAALLALLAAAAARLVVMNRRIGQEATRWHTLVETWPEPMLLIDGDRLVVANQAAARLVGAPDRAAFLAAPPGGHSPARQPDGEDSMTKARRLIRLAAEGEPQHFDWSLRHADGAELCVDATLAPLQLDGRPVVLCAWHDISERKQAEEKLQLAASVFTHAREGILITDTTGAVIDANDSFSRITGYCRAEALGHTPDLLSPGQDDQEAHAAMWRELHASGHWHGEIWNRRKDGEAYPATLTISAVADPHGRTKHYVALFSDITAAKAHEQQLEHIAHYDALTGLANRVLLADRLRQAMVQAQRRKLRLAVVYLDLDGFKAVNDSHGHEVGDQLLVTVATRMKDALRESDTVARLGGDEFVAVLGDLADIDSCLPMLERLLAAAAQPVRVGQLELQVTGSLGVTFYPQPDEVDADQLLRQADQAMYQAKLAGKNRFSTFDGGPNRLAPARDAEDEDPGPA